MIEIIEEAIKEGLIHFLKLTPETINIGGRITPIQSLEKVGISNELNIVPTLKSEASMVLKNILNEGTASVIFDATCIVGVSDESGNFTKTELKATSVNGTLSKPNDSFHFEIKSISFQNKFIV